MSGETQPLVTVAILTWNGDVYLERILQSVLAQEVDGEVEVLVIDSGSTDSTLDIVRRFPSVRLHEIPNSEFGHGKTRNLAATLARGEFIAYLTHDAIPIGPRWLAELLAPFAVSDRLVAVMGKQVPRAGCFPLLKYEIEQVFAGFGPDFGTTLFFKDRFDLDEGTLSAVAFYSDVNSATRTRFVRDVIPYQDVRYAEDQLFGRDLVVAGYQKAYAPRAAVEHSNDMTLAEYGQRIFDETVALREIGREIPVLTRAVQLRMTIRGILADSARIVLDPSLSRKRKLYWLVINPRYHAAKWRGYRSATLVDLADEAALRSGSLEHSRKSASDRA